MEIPAQFLTDRQELGEVSYEPEPELGLEPDPESEAELARDLDYLLNLWKAILTRVKGAESPATRR